MPNTNHPYKLADLPSGFDSDVLVAEIEASPMVTKLLGVTAGVPDQEGKDLHLLFVDALPAGEKTTLDGDADPPATGSILGDHAGPPSPLERAKVLKIADIDRRSRALIRNGFQHGGKTFSLSANAQLSLIGDFAARNDLSYPVKWNTKNDRDTASFADAVALKALILAGFTARNSHRNSGTALKDAVRAATTIAEVDAVVDNR